MDSPQTKERSANTPLAKHYDLPTFEDAFEEESLKKFFQAQDSDDSAFSTPIKTSEMIEEESSPQFDSRGLLSSPLARFIQRMSDEHDLHNPKFNIELNPTFHAEVPEIHHPHLKFVNEQEQTPHINLQGFGENQEKWPMNGMNHNNSHYVFHPGLSIHKSASVPVENPAFDEITQQQDQQPYVKPTLDHLIKNKKVFKIQRDARSSNQHHKTHTPSPVKSNSFGMNLHNSTNQYMNVYPYAQSGSIPMNGHMLLNRNLQQQHHNISIMNYVTAMKEKSVKPEDLMPELKNFMQNQIRGNPNGVSMLNH